MDITLADLFLAVTEAVFSYTLERLDPADRLGKWLKYNPVKLAYQKALARAYTVFDQEYPEFTELLFDQSFLTIEAKPELAKMLTRHGHPDPTHLAELWAASIRSPAGVQLALTAASDFLQLFEFELKTEAVFQPLFDSRALESLPAIETKLDKLTDELRQALDIALSIASQQRQRTTHTADVTNVISGMGAIQNTGYKHDVFLSYTHNFVEAWVLKHFLPLFKWHLEGALGRAPAVFIDREGIQTGESWPLRLKEALARSKCLVAIWSPSYFQSLWCMRECLVMFHREKHIGYRTVKNPGGLVLPVNVSDGKHFPEYAKYIQYFDCRDFTFVGEAFAKSRRYLSFQLEMKTWAEQVAQAINQVPPWKKEWLEDLDINTPEPPASIFLPPYLE